MTFFFLTSLRKCHVRSIKNKEAKNCHFTAPPPQLVLVICSEVPKVGLMKDPPLGRKGPPVVACPPASQQSTCSLAGTAEPR